MLSALMALMMALSASASVDARWVVDTLLAAQMGLQPSLCCLLVRYGVGSDGYVWNLYLLRYFLCAFIMLLADFCVVLYCVCLLLVNVWWRVFRYCCLQMIL